MGIAVAGATYSVNIELNHQSLNKQLDDLNTKVNTIGKSSAKKAATSKEEEQTLTSTNNLLNRNAVQYGRGLRLNKKGVSLELQKANYLETINKIGAGEIEQARELISFSKLRNTEEANNLLIKQKAVKADTESAKKDKIRVKGVHDLNKARHTNFNLRSRLDDLDAKGIKVDKLRLKYGDLNTAQGKRDFNLFKDIGSQLNLSLKKEERKLRVLRKQTTERHKQLRMFSRRSINMASPIRGDAIRDVGSPAWIDRSARMGGPRSKLNYQRGRLLPGPLGTGGRGASSGVWQSAAISGAFPLLFGQGPVTAAAGALGGGLGAKYGGQMGGFAGGLATTSAVTAIGGAINATKELGQAMGPYTKDVDALITATGNANSFRAKEIELLKEYEGEAAAFEAAMKDMTILVGERGVEALRKFGEDMDRAGDDFQKLMTRIQAAIAGVINWTGIMREGKKSLISRGRSMKDTDVQDLIAKRDEINANRGDYGGWAGQRQALMLNEKDLRVAIANADKVLLDQQNDQIKKAGERNLAVERMNDLY